MNVHSNMTQHDLNNLTTVPEKRKSQRAFKNQK